MPNWCNNSIEIVGPRDKIKALWEQAIKEEDQGGGLLRGMRPEPNYDEVDVLPTFPGIVGNNEPVDKGQSWWDWRVQNWGTKWEVGVEGLEFEQDEDGNYDNGGKGPHARITGGFTSAWSPPVTAFAFYAEQNPDVRMKLDYYESAMCFVGRAEFEDGEMLYDDCFEFSGYTSKDIRDFIGDEIDDFWGISESMAEWEEENGESPDELEEFLEEGAEVKGLNKPEPIKFD